MAKIKKEGTHVNVQLRKDVHTVAKALQTKHNLATISDALALALSKFKG